MSDTLVVAISQSGTTTDTNRTVDLARARGAVVVAIVNRRQSDLVDKSDGVLYTSDGRDVEMSVASTKAFYAQLAAGHPARVRDSRPSSAPTTSPTGRTAASCSWRCASCPTAMHEVFARRPAIARRRAAARAVAAVVGGRRQRREPDRRARAADQALGALLQVDRLRRHRGQEAHRPLVRADDPRVRGRVCTGRTPTTSPRRSRSTARTRPRRS